MTKLERINRENKVTDMKDFVEKAKNGCWDAHTLLTNAKGDEAHNIRSWVYDAASILDIMMNDSKMLVMLADYYKHPEKLPWNKPRQEGENK